MQTMEANGFMTWDMLSDYATFVTVVFLIVQAIKELPKVRNIPTRIVSIVIAFVLQLAANVQNGQFKPVDAVMYLVSALIISLTANAVADSSVTCKDRGVAKKNDY